MPPIVPRKRLRDASPPPVDRTSTPKKPKIQTKPAKSNSTPTSSSKPPSKHQPLPRGTPAKPKQDDSHLKNKDLEAALADDKYLGRKDRVHPDERRDLGISQKSVYDDEDWGQDNGVKYIYESLQ